MTRINLLVDGKIFLVIKKNIMYLFQREKVSQIFLGKRRKSR